MEIKADNYFKIDDQIKESFQDLQALENEPNVVNNPEELEELEHKILNATNKLAALLLQKKLQHSLDVEDQKKKKKN